MASLKEAEASFKYGGYYKIDIDSHITVLSVNTMYLNKKNDNSKQGSEAEDILAWMRSHLTLAKQQGRKFILTNHIYAGAKYSSNSKDLLVSSYNDEYFNILAEFRDSIILEVSAHDHYSDVRYHTDKAAGFYYHNMLVSPGVTPIDHSNPGVATFEVDSKTLTP